MALYCVIPTEKETLLEQYVQGFEQQTNLTAIVAGIHVLSNVQENEVWRMLGRIRETVNAFGTMYALHTMYSFVLLADEEQLNPEIRALMEQNNVQIMSEEEFETFKKTLQ